MNNDLIFVVKGDGSYQATPNRNLRSQENYSDSFVVIANQTGVLKAKIKLLSRTDKVEVKYLVPTTESVESFIGDKPYFQDYAGASVWRGAVPKKLLQEISMSYAGQIEVSFSFLKPVLDSRATNYKGDILTGDTLPETATNGDYYVIKVATYTIGEIVLKYGQTAIWDGAWVKGGTYQVIGTTTTQKMNVEPTLIGEEAEFDIDEADEIHEALEEHAQAISELEIGVDDHELRISTNEQDIDKIEDDLVKVDTRVDNIIAGTVDGVSGAEIVDARDGYTVLGDRLDFESYQEQRNAQNIAKRSVYNSRFVQTLRPLVTIIDDDGKSAVLTTLKTIAEDYDIPVGVALIGTSAVVVDDVKRAELLNLQNTKNWEILSHTMTHTWLGDMTSQEIEDDCKLFIKTFNEYGFNVFNFVYPYSNPNNNASKIISKYYSAGFGTGSNYNTQENIDEYNIYRVNIGAVYDGIPTKTLQEYKDIVDLVKTNNGWLVLMTHIGDTDSTGVQMIRDVLDYVVLQNIEIVTPTDGLRVFGSVTQSGLKNEPHVHIKGNGLIESNTYAFIRRDTRLETDPPSTTQSQSNIVYFQVSGWTIGNGLVFEYIGSNGFQYQEFRKTGNRPETYVRKWTGSSWLIWYRNALTLDNFNLTVTARTIPANSCETITKFESGALSSHVYNAQPTGQLEEGIIWSCWSYGDGAYRLRLCNPTNSPIELAERVWKIHRIFA